MVVVGPCDPGQYCEGHADRPNPEPYGIYTRNGDCEAGKFCPNGTTTPVNCPVGTFRNTTGKAAMDWEMGVVLTLLVE